MNAPTNDKEAVIRVVASAMESLIQSRPRMNPRWVLETAYEKPMASGNVTISHTRSPLGTASKLLYRMTIVAARKGWNEKVVLVYIREQHRWLDTTRGFPRATSISQSEAERLAAQSFTAPHEVQHISDVAIDEARHLLSSSGGPSWPA